jgi:hypothetical protein
VGFLRRFFCNQVEDLESKWVREEAALFFSFFFRVGAWVELNVNKRMSELFN